MRRCFFSTAVLLTGLIYFSTGVFAQTPEPLRTSHYAVYAEDREAGKQIAGDLEGRFDVYNRLFRFDPEMLEAPLRVRLIPDPEAYRAYVSERLGEGRPGAVYLHYSGAERRELVIQTPAEALPYQAFIQYLRAFIPHPPSWIQEGFALYFNTVTISAAGELGYVENLSWLEKTKNMTLPPAESILLADSGIIAAPFPREDFPALSWALVSFFLNSGNEDYFRSLLESFMLLSPESSAAENSLVVAERIKTWNGFENLTRDMGTYLASRKTFAELMEEGRATYAAGDYMTATYLFSDALDLRPGHYAPYYYLGMIYYGNGSWYWAEEYYNQSLERGADKALVHYALGLNAAAAGLIEKAAALLRDAAEEDPGRYREKADALLKTLGL
jgi:tetratricopeptide (TPR) repeat protein